MLFPGMSRDIRVATLAAVQAGQKIMAGEFRGGSIAADGEEKGDRELGHHAKVTNDDIGSQKFLLTRIAPEFPQACFIVEEKSDVYRDRIILRRSLETLPKEKVTFSIDALDGSSSNSDGHYEWAVSVGVMRENLYHAGGGIYAPDVRGNGMLVYGERGKGVFLKERGRKEVPCRVRDRGRKDASIFIGPDIFFMLDRFGKFLNAAAKVAHRTGCNWSCALPLAEIAAGKIDALIEPVQMPWDWAAGFPLVEEAGGKVIFYDYASGRLEEVVLTPERYDPKSHTVAFIAGVPGVVDWLWELLRENWTTA